MILAFLAAAAITASPAATPANPEAAAPAEAKPADPLICHNEVIAGSRVPTKVCMRRSSVEAQARDGRAMTEKMQSGVVLQSKGH